MKIFKFIKFFLTLTCFINGSDRVELEKAAFWSDEANVWLSKKDSVPFTGDYFLNFKSSDILEWEGTLTDGVDDGLLKEFYKSGNIRAKWYYKNRKEEGLQERWYENGKKMLEVTFKDGKEEGLQEQWYENGQKMLEVTFKDGKQDGLLNEWYENGQKKYEVNYKDGIKDGLSKIWYESGALKQELPYKNDKSNGLVKQWYENGTIYSELNYVNSKREGEGKFYYKLPDKKQGPIKTICFYENDALDGEFITYREDGSKIRKSIYENDEKNGKEFEYYISGNKKSMVQYSYGKLVGERKEYKDENYLKIIVGLLSFFTIPIAVVWVLQKKGLIKKPKPFKDRSWKEILLGEDNEVEVSDQINSSNDVKGDLAILGGLLVYGLWIIPSFSIENWFSGGYFYINKWLITTFNITEDWDIGAAAGATPGNWIQAYPMDPNDGPLNFMAWLIFFAIGGAVLLNLGNIWKKKFKLEFLLYDWINTFPKEYRNKNIRYDEIEKSGVKKLNKGEDGTYWFSYPDKENELDSQIHLLFNQKEEVLYFKNDLSCEWLVIPRNQISADEKSELINTIELKLNDRSILLSIPSISSIENILKLFPSGNSINDKILTKEKDNQGISNKAFENIKKYKELLDSGVITEKEFSKKKKELIDL